MRVSLLLLAMMGCLGWASPASALGPTPPAVLPDHLLEPVNGYSMWMPFQKWRTRVERQKGEALRQAMASPPVVEGERQIGRTFLTVEYRGDLGVVGRDELRTFCPTGNGWSFEEETCHYLYRRGEIPARAAVHGGVDNPVARWMRETFDAEQVATAMRAADVGPDGDLRGVDEEILFAGHPSAIPVLLENVELVTVDSRACPALHQAVRALDRGRIGWRTDILAVGDDDRPRPPRPHAITATYALEILTGRGFLTMSGDDETLEAAVSPAVKAAEACLGR